MNSEESLKFMEIKKKPLYVEIYEKLFQFIETKGFHEGDRLPGENSIASELGVSRTTLRQALVLMTEDGVIRRIHGKGNFIANLTPRNLMGLENIENPVTAFATVPVDEVNIDIRFEVASEYVMKLFGYEKSRVVMASDRWYKSGSCLIACCFAFSDLDVIASHNIDIQNAEIVNEFLKKQVYELSSTSLIHINITNRREFSNINIKMESNALILLSETLYSSENQILTHNKYYLDPLYFDLVANGRHVNRI